MYSIGTIVNNTVFLYLKVAKRVDLKKMLRMFLTLKGNTS